MVFPYQMWVGGADLYQMQIRVPIDDTHTWILSTPCTTRGADTQERDPR